MPAWIMVIFIHKKDTLQIMITSKQQSPNLRMPVESYKKTYLADNNNNNTTNTIFIAIL